MRATTVQASMRTHGRSVDRVASGPAMRTELEIRARRADDEIMDAVGRMFELADDRMVPVPAGWRSLLRR